MSKAWNQRRARARQRLRRTRVTQKQRSLVRAIATATHSGAALQSLHCLDLSISTSPQPSAQNHYLARPAGKARLMPSRLFLATPTRKCCRASWSTGAATSWSQLQVHWNRLCQQAGIQIMVYQAHHVPSFYLLCSWLPEPDDVSKWASHTNQTIPGTTKRHDGVPEFCRICWFLGSVPITQQPAVLDLLFAPSLTQGATKHSLAAHTESFCFGISHIYDWATKTVAPKASLLQNLIFAKNPLLFRHL